jgi:hypothetical protein
MVGVGG